MPQGVLKSCNNNNLTAGVSGFRFPSNPFTCSEWISIVARERRDDFYKSTKNLVICSYHFDKSDISGNTKRRRLVKTAVSKLQYPHKRISVILCGDFNSVPSCGVYQLYTTGESPSTLPDWKSNKDEAVYDLCLEQSISLASACGTPPFTNYTAEFADCLDYIFYDKTNLEVEQVVPLPSIDELKLHTALPSVVFPSDHVALVSDLRFK